MTNKKKRIRSSAKELFCANGFKDTNIAEITKRAGVATGTFYNYYASKDSLFLDLFLEENVNLKKRIMANLDLDASPFEAMSIMIDLNMQGMCENPILKEWYNREIFSKIEKVYRDEKGLDALDFMYVSFIDIVKMWQSDGRIRRDIAPEMIMAIFSALINVETHKDEIGLQYFPQVVEYLSEFTMQGLTIIPENT